MSFLDTLLGRTKPRRANLDALFALPAATVTLDTETGLKPAGWAAVAFRPASGQAFAEVRTELEELLGMSARESQTELREEDDAFGYRWVVLSDPDPEDLVGSVHLINVTLEDRGFGPQLLCSVFAFAPDAGGRAVLLVYLYKRGTFYPFAPLPGERRDVELELRLRGILQEELPVEQDLGRWFPLWGAPIA